MFPVIVNDAVPLLMIRNGLRISTLVKIRSILCVPAKLVSDFIVNAPLRLYSHIYSKGLTNRGLSLQPNNVKCPKKPMSGKNQKNYH